MRAYNRKRKHKHMTRVSILKNKIKGTYMKKLSFVNKDFINYGGIYHDLVSHWKNKTGWLMETTVFYFPKEYRKHKENIQKQPFPKYIGVRTFYFDNYHTTKNISFEKF